MQRGSKIACANEPEPGVPLVTAYVPVSEIGVVLPVASTCARAMSTSSVTTACADCCSEHAPAPLSMEITVTEPVPRLKPLVELAVVKMASCAAKEWPATFPAAVFDDRVDPPLELVPHALLIASARSAAAAFRACRRLRAVPDPKKASMGAF